MKAHHKKLVTAAAAARKALDTEKAKAEKLQASLAESHAQIAVLAGSLSEIESEAADSGLAVSELHAAIKG